MRSVRTQQERYQRRMHTLFTQVRATLRCKTLRPASLSLYYCETEGLQVVGRRIPGCSFWLSAAYYSALALVPSYELAEPTSEQTVRKPTKKEPFDRWQGSSFYNQGNTISATVHGLKVASRELRQLPLGALACMPERQPRG